MGIIVENQEWAANADKHGEAMYKKTNNPYYLIKALAAARLVNWEPPAWALAPCWMPLKTPISTLRTGKGLEYRCTHWIEAQERRSQALACLKEK